MSVEPESENTNKNSRLFLIGTVVALGFLALLVVLSGGRSAEPETQASKNVQKPGQETVAPPADSLVVPPTEPDLPKPPDYKLVAKVWAKICKGEKCDEPKRIDAQVSVRDKFGEVAKYPVKADAHATITMPPGTYNLVGLDSDGNESIAKEVVFPESGTGTISAELTIVRK